jgi:hypothetical protein
MRLATEPYGRHAGLEPASIPQSVLALTDSGLLSAGACPRPAVGGRGGNDGLKAYYIQARYPVLYPRLRNY